MDGVGTPRPTAGRRRFVRRIRRLDVPTIRAAWWTVQALRRTRKQLPASQVGAVRVVPPPGLPRYAERGVHAVLRRVPNTCLERALVLQCWLSAYGVEKEIIVGVTGASEFKAHAWLDGEPVDETFKELMRLPATGQSEP
jgi:hypothetical protein